MTHLEQDPRVLVTMLDTQYQHHQLRGLQSRVAPAMRGRSMSLLMFASVGLNPVSTALAGVFMGVKATTFLVGAGTLMTSLTLLAAYSPALRKLRL